MSVITWQMLYEAQPQLYEELREVLDRIAQEEGLDWELIPASQPFQSVWQRHGDYLWEVVVRHPQWAERWKLPWPVYYDPHTDRAIFFLSGKFWSYYPKLLDREALRLLTYRNWLAQNWKGLLRWRKKTPSAKANFSHRLQQSAYMFSPNDHTIALSEHRIRYLRERDANRYVHPGYLGRIDLVTTPEGESVGLSLVLATGARVDPEGYILAKYIALDTGEVLWLRAEESFSQRVRASQEGEVYLERGNLFSGSPQLQLDSSALGVALSLVPFVEYNDANRLTMAGNHLRQSVPLLDPQLPRVRTEFHDQHPELLLGRELRVAYGSFLGLTYEDAVVVSQSAAEQLAVDWKKIVEFRVHSDEVVVHEASAHIGDDVHASKPLLVKLRKARAGDSAYMLLKALGKGLESRIEVFPPAFLSGKVTDYWEESDTVFFQVVDRRPLRVGDKVVGRFGNKGIVSAILPDSQMPTTPEGTPVQMVISPASVISRMNLGQLYETWIQAILERIRDPEQLCALQAQHPLLRFAEWREEGAVFVYPSFQRGVQLAEFPPLLAQLGLDPGGTQTVRWPGGSAQMTVGRQHIVRLYHFAIDKIHARSTSGARSLGYPARGRKNHGGQRVGEMEVRALLAHNARAVLTELPFRCDGNYINFNFHLMNHGTIHAAALTRMWKLRSSYQQVLTILGGLGLEVVEVSEEAQQEVESV